MKALRFLAFLFLLFFGITLFVLQLSQQSAMDVEGTLSVHISSGENVQDIAQTLKEHGIIRSAMAFRWYLKSRDIDTQIQPGTFSVPPGASFSEIADLLEAGGETEISITIPEGYSIMQIDELLVQKGLVEAGEVIECATSRCDFSSFEDFLPEKGSIPNRLEGYLFPDTYFVDRAEFVSKFFLERLLGTFRSRVVEELKDDIGASGRSLHEVITMASLIERETRKNDERSIVSGILWKRYDAGRGLDVDATVRYALSKPTEPLTKEDLATDSAYNTRKYAGLPPGPIANAGMKSIEAALNPESSDYWYYLHGRDGQIQYSETNEEHNEKKARYL